ncbi:MAG: signal peptide peptidase SppA, partial [Polyangiaceae bacterium]|nr:signal peptide peptidase SppA [Polyangiaceae bacterium]
DALRLLRARGKKVVCHLEDAGGRALHTCAHADRVVVNPAGGIRFAGLHIDRTYLAGLMRKLGVRAQFVRIGVHKSAPEQFTNTSPSDVAEEDSRQNLAQIESEMIASIAQGRNLAPAQVRAALSRGPFTAREALADRLVDGFAYDDELRTVVSEVVGRSIVLRENLPSEAPKRFGHQRKLAIVYVDGNIVDGRSQNIPFLGIRLVGSYTIAESLKHAREDPSVGAIVLRVESPGGSSMASDVMWREIVLAAREKPVVVSMGGVAASGGYYVAAPGTKIYASPFTVTGSIGIFYGKADVAELLTKVGVNVTTLKTTPHADAESIYRPFTQEEAKLLGGKVKQFYDVFIDRVARGRKMSPDKVDAVARGRVWMGREAARHGLVDEIGGLRQALETARREGALPDDAPIIELPPPDFSLIAFASRMVGSQEQQPSILQGAVQGQVRQLLRDAAPFVIYDPFQPLALCESTVVP